MSEQPSKVREYILTSKPTGASSIAVRRSAVNVAPMVLATLLAYAPRRAEAHPEFTPATVNRYLKVSLVEPEAVRLSYTLTVGAAPALVLRKQADGNADGQIDERESRALAARWARVVESGLRVELDDRPLVLRFDDAVAGLAGAEVAPSPFSVDLTVRLPVAAGAHTLRLDDSVEVPSPGETEIRVEESPQVHLIATGLSRDATTRETRFHWPLPRRSGLENRTVWVRFAADAPRGARGMWLALGVGLLVLLAGGGWALRRYRNMKG